MDQNRIITVSTNIPELTIATILGYTHDFVLLDNGLLRCLTDKNTRDYDLDEIDTKCIPISTIPMATLFLIETDTGIKGTMIHYHENIF